MTQHNQSAAETVFVVRRVRFEHLREALGIGLSQPRISWVVETAAPHWMQSAYEIEQYSPEGALRASTGQVASDQSVLVPWPFEPLASRQQARVRVRVWGSDGRCSEWSEAASVEAGLLAAQDWSAQWISPDWDEDARQPQPGPLLRREFTVKASVRQARLYITARGAYEAQINGQPVGDQVLAPGWTSYQHRLLYQTYDVTGLLREGPNAVGALLGNGWFRGRLGYGGGRKNIYGDRLALLAQLEITYADGSVERLASDSNWRAVSGPILASEMYDGETYDARLERGGWSQAGYDDSGWSGVRRLERGPESLDAPLGPPIRRIETLSPVAIIPSPSGKILLDFGQNLVGRLRLTVQGPAGQAVTLRHAEVLEHGELSTRPLRHARATDTYILKGGGVETWEPRFTYHGFRYAEISGWPGALKPGDVQAVVCHSEMERTGWFECSDALLNRFHENVVWSTRGNFFSVPTDCPQRDERLGWTGDIQVFSPAASFLFDAAGFLSSWLIDLAAEQAESGSVPYFVPMAGAPSNPPAAAWGDAAVIVPWVLYQRFGDAGVLARQFESMRAWVDQLASIAGESRLWGAGVQFGDWLDPAAPPDKPGEARTPAFIVATAYFARSAELLGQAARVLGRSEDEQRYLRLADEVRAAFNAQYVTPAGRVLSDTATAYALALQFALLEDEKQRRLAGERLAELVHANRYRISTGFVGTPLVCDALCSAGETEKAFRLLLQTENPSWLYPVTMGATTIWERWDSLLPDGSVNPGEMTSFNHYALGAVADWLHRTVAGLAPAAPGYRRLEIAPKVGGGLTRASAQLVTPYGPAESAWSLADGRFDLDVVLPPNTRATVSLPGPDGKSYEVGSGRHHWSVAYPPEGRQPASLSMDMTIGELIDSPAAFRAVFDIFSRDNFELAARLETQTAMRVRAAAALMNDARGVTAQVKAVLEG